MKKQLILVVSILLVLMLLSCDDSKKVPRIYFNSPSDGQVFNGGSIAQIDVKIKDDGDAILNEELYVITSNNDTILNKKESEFCFEYNFYENFSVMPNEVYRIVVKSRGGHGNWTSKYIQVSGN